MPPTVLRAVGRPSRLPHPCRPRHSSHTQGSVIPAVTTGIKITAAVSATAERPWASQPPCPESGFSPPVSATRTAGVAATRTAVASRLSLRMRQAE